MAVSFLGQTPNALKFFSADDQILLEILFL